MAVTRDQNVVREAIGVFTEELERLTARQALSKRFNPKHNDRLFRTEQEKVGGAKSLALKALGEIVIPDADEGPPIDPDERRRRDLYRKQMERNRGL